MKFSVLLSLYYKESPSALAQSLESIFNQTLRANEVILVEDGPLTPELYDIVSDFKARYQELRTIPLKQNQGLGMALNCGIKFCTYELIARMDTDDICKIDRFEKQVNMFKKDPSLDVCSSWVEEFEGDISNILTVKKIPENNEQIYAYAKKRNPINHPAVMFKKNAVLSAGGYRHFPLFEDYYLWVRMLMNGAKFYNIQNSLLYFRSSRDMFKRRGGKKYISTEIRFIRHIERIGFIGKYCASRNIAIRFFARIIPNDLRSWLYKKYLRK